MTGPPAGRHPGVAFLRACGEELRALTNGTRADTGARRLLADLDAEPEWRLRRTPELPAAAGLAAAAADTLHPPVPLPPGLFDLFDWVPSPRMSDGGSDAALCLINDHLDLPSVEVGLMALAPFGTYPLHRHPPEETYLTLLGTGRWRSGGREDLQIVGPGALVHNRPLDLHTAIAGETPLLALYLLWD